jgi:dienelactone hydrolase
MPALAIALCAALLFFFAGPCRAEGLIQEELRIPAAYPGLFGERALRLEALAVRPDDAAAHPLALLTHGAPRDESKRRSMTPQAMLPQAREFARRGFSAVIVMRRGYGESEGQCVEGYAGSLGAAYGEAGLKGAQDLRQAILYLRGLPWVDSGRVLAVGVSAGGFAITALTTDPPPGLVAAISFAGGRGSVSDDTVKDEPALIQAFATYGRDSRLPMLWVYAENDRYFRPGLSRQFFEAFAGRGGRAEFVLAPAFGKDGHALFSLRGIPVWTPIVDRFLAAHDLRLRETPLDLPAAATPAPKGLSKGGRAAFKEYLSSPPRKAFALSEDGAFGWRSGLRSEAEARKEALAGCRRHAKKECRVVMVDEEMIEE